MEFQALFKLIKLLQFCYCYVFILVSNMITKNDVTCCKKQIFILYLIEFHFLTPVFSLVVFIKVVSMGIK